MTINKQLKMTALFNPLFIGDSSFNTTLKVIALDQLYIALLGEPATSYLHSSMLPLSDYKQAAAMTQCLSTQSTPASCR